MRGDQQADTLSVSGRRDSDLGAHTIVSLSIPLPPFVMGERRAQVTTTSLGDFSRSAFFPDAMGFGLGSEARCDETWDRRCCALF